MIPFILQIYNTKLDTALNSKGPSRPGRFCIPFTDAKPAREMHMRRNLLDGDGRKNWGWRVDLRLDSMDIVKIFPCGNYRKSYRTL